MSELFEIAGSISTPIGLAALGLLVVYALLALMLRAGLFSRLSSADSAVLLGGTIHWVGALAALCVLVYLATVLVARSSPERNGAAPVPVVTAPISPSPTPTSRGVDPQSLRNMTYVLDDERITLIDGALEFAPAQTGDARADASPLYVYLTHWALGDLQGNGTDDAVAVLQKSDGGSGIYYYLVPVLAKGGRIVADAAGFVLGDRLQFRRIEIDGGEVRITALMHRETDALSQPTLLRELRLKYHEGQWVCLTKPCSEIQGK